MLLQILEQKWITVLFRADGDCTVFVCFFQWFAFIVFSWKQVKVLIPFPLLVLLSLTHTLIKQIFLPPTCFLGCQTPLPCEVVELSLLGNLYCA